MSAHPTLLAAQVGNGAASGQGESDRGPFSRVSIEPSGEDASRDLTLSDVRPRSPNPIARLLLGVVWLYQKTLSPVLPALFGPTCGCRFYPTCSHYAADAVRTHGALFGSWLALRRLAKCTPLHPGGLDPVPAPRTRRCTRVTA